MIVVWPLITSKTVNPNILPGVCKSLEKYIYIHQIDAVLEAARASIAKKNRKSSINIKIKKYLGRRVLKLESIENGETIEEYLNEAGKKTSSSSSPSKKTSSSNSPSKKGTSYGLSSGGGGGGSSSYSPPPVTNEAPKFGKVDQSLISSEPTWNHVTDQEGNTTAIGVKVVPFVIQNEQSLIKLMTLDRYRKGLDKNLHYEARRILRLIQKIGNFAWKATAGLFSWTGLIDSDLVKGTITQDWKNDIILQNTTFKKNMFIMLNKIDLKDDFTQSAGGVKGLFKLGWSSFIIADEISKTVSFCMNTYKGMCSQLNYSFIYADSRSQAQVYRDLEDVKAASGPLFRLNRRKKAMITDDIAQYKLDLYSQDTLVEGQYLSESLAPDLMKQIKTNPKIIANNLKAMFSAIKRKKIDVAYKISRKLNPSNKRLDINRLIDKSLKTNPKFKKNYNISYNVFKNSIPGLPEDVLKVGASIISMLAVINKDKNYNIKNDLKKIVIKTRAVSKDEFSGDLKIAFIFALIFIITLGPAVLWLAYLLTSWVGTAGAAVYSVFPHILIITGILYVLQIFTTNAETASAKANSKD